MTDPFITDTFAHLWDRFTDGACPPDFVEEAEALGLIELVPVTEEALEDPFAEERGIVAGGTMWQLTEAGKARIK